ncbi:MAG: CheR family methyltransferase [Pararobbsia sp.]
MIDARFETLLRREIGLDAASIGSASIERARCGNGSPRSRGTMRCAPRGRSARRSLRAHSDSYWLELCASSEERQRLVEAVVVPETWFFRDREAFTALAKLARERHAREPERRLRLLSLPCSSGEEPYSMAMALLDAGLPPRRSQSMRSTSAHAPSPWPSACVYGRNAFRGHRLEFRDRHFTPVADGWHLAAPVRKTVRFARMNLFDAGLLANGPYDFVFCRNLLIYFDRDDQGARGRHARSAVVPRARCSSGRRRPGRSFGMRCTRRRSRSHSRSTSPRPRCRRRRRRHAGRSNRCVLMRRCHDADTAGGSTPARASGNHSKANDRAGWDSRTGIGMRGTGSRPSTGTGTHARALTNPAVGEPVVPRESAAQRRAAELAAALHLANLGRLREATIAADTHLDNHGPSAEVFYLLGLIADADGRAARRKPLLSQDALPRSAPL